MMYLPDFPYLDLFRVFFFPVGEGWDAGGGGKYKVKYLQLRSSKFKPLLVEQGAFEWTSMHHRDVIKLPSVCMRVSIG